jgi:flagellar biosynthesis protein FlhF
MRLKTFSAATMPEAMEEVRRVLGRDAVIVSTFEGRRGTGVQVTAALEDALPQPDEIPEQDQHPGSGPSDDPLTEALQFHGLPRQLLGRLVDLSKSMELDDAEAMLAGALDAGFDFAPLNLMPRKPVMLVGQPGAGKTVTVAKLAARAVMAGKKVRVITTDTIRAGGVAQLRGFTDILNTALEKADAPDILRNAISDAEDDELILIDSPGTNPFNSVEIRDLKRFLAIEGIEPVLVIAAGGDVAEASDIATAWRPLGIRRMIFTRLDATRRYGAIVAAADSTGFILGDVSLSPYVAEGLKVLNPVTMARLLLRQETLTTTLSENEEKAAQ